MKLRQTLQWSDSIETFKIFSKILFGVYLSAHLFQPEDFELVVMIAVFHIILTDKYLVL